MSVITRRLRRLEAQARAQAPSGLSDFNDAELQILHLALMRRMLDCDTLSAHEREDIAKRLAEEEREGARRQAYYSRPDVASAIASNVAAGHCEPLCACDALPYPHSSHRPEPELCA